MSSPLLRRARTRSAVSIVIAPAVAGEGFAGVGGDELVEDGALAVFRAQDSAEALDVLAHGAAAAEDDGDVGVGDVDAFVQDFGGDDGAVATVGEALEGFAAFGDFGLVR